MILNEEIVIMQTDLHKQSDIGTRIRSTRELIGYSREYLAEISDISTKYLYEIETGDKDFSAKILYRLARNLEISMEYIMDGRISYNNKNEEIVEIYRKIKNICF